MAEQDEKKIARTLGDAFKLYPVNEKILGATDSKTHVLGEKTVRHETPVVGVDDKGAEVPGIRFQKPPIEILQQERYEHRVIAFLKLEGKSNTEIAQETGFTDSTISYILKQPWVEELILQEIHKRGGSEVNAFFQESALPAVKLLAQVVKDADAANKDRINAAKAILDRAGFGPSSEVSVRHSKDIDEYSDEELVAIITGAGSTSGTGTQNS